MSNSSDHKPKAPIHRLSDEDTPVGEALDDAAAEYTPVDETVSWTPNDDELPQPDTKQTDSRGAGD